MWLYRNILQDRNPQRAEVIPLNIGLYQHIALAKPKWQEGSVINKHLFRLLILRNASGLIGLNCCCLKQNV